MGLSQSDEEMVYLDPARIEGREWIIYVCAEPDGQNCMSGTHPNICRHECAAITKMHEQAAAAKTPDEHAAIKGPKIAMIRVKPVPGQGQKPHYEDQEQRSDNLDNGVHAAISWTYIGGDRAEESLLRIRKALKDPLGSMTAQDEEDYRALRTRG